MGRPVEVTEDAAVGRAREIYQDVRTCLGTPIVNQIYRRIAAIPDCLEWSWGTIRPHVVSGLLEREADGMVRGLGLTAPEPITRDMLVSAGIDDEALAVICRVFDVYNRTNPINLIVVKTISAALESQHDARPFQIGELPGIGQSNSPLPPLLDVAKAEPGVQEVMARLATLASGGSGAVVPTLFRHFGDWPNVLRVMADIIGPINQSGALAQKISELEASADETSRRVLHADEFSLVEGIPPPTATSCDALRDVLRIFPPTISGMVVIGRTLRLALPS